MSFIKLIFLTAFIIIVSSTSMYARVRIPIGEREVLIKVYDLPNTDDNKLNGNYLDLATFHKEFGIPYFLPLYITQDPKLVLYDQKMDRYYEPTQKEMDDFLKSQKLNGAELNQLPFYTKYCGKILAAILLVLIVFAIFPSKKEKIEKTYV